MSLSRTWRRRRGETKWKKEEAARDHRITGYALTDKALRWLKIEEWREAGKK